jgi:hypothetical protein
MYYSTINIERAIVLHNTEDKLRGIILKYGVQL